MKSFRPNLTAIILIAVILLGVSCKKESAPQTNTTQEKLIGKWNLISDVSNDFYNGTPHITNYSYQPGDYLEFKSDGTATTYQSGSTLTYDYGIVSELKIWVGLPGNITELKVFTGTDLQLYKKNVSGTDYYESTTTLKRQ